MITNDILWRRANATHLETGLGEARARHPGVEK
jgi:hypothetical protein